AEVNQRTKRLTRCQRCHTERADGRNSLAAVHPELVAEWDVTANRPLRPERIKATYDKAVVWRCPDDPGHPPYRMSPATRARRPIGCPLHRKMRQREASQAA
ncbi:MAG: zinc-ribbon domain-containing protein, partial [Chloroflexi bacterium]|nr:zinc-ribbon domain-containing protein [Chloroflexota bacterium]